MFSSSHERAIRICLTAIAASSLLALAGIVIFLFTEGLPLFRHVSPLDFLLGDLWYPTEDPGLFGIFPLLVGSVAVTVLSSLLAVPLGVMTAVYLAEIAPPFARRVIKPFVELLAALPSVVLGFLGMVVLAPILQDVLGAATGLNLLNASLVLAIMSLPTICSVSEDALRAVPRSLREASLALGATRWETIVRVVVPAALSGIGTAIMLGMSRAMGETMVVLMAAGGAAMLPQSLLDPVRPMPASIAAEMASELESPLRPLWAMVVYGLAAWGIALLTNKSIRVRRFITGKPLILMDSGVIYRKNLRRARMDLNEFLMYCRVSGYFDLDQIQTAILEHNGTVTFLPAAMQRPVTPADLSMQPQRWCRMAGCCRRICRRREGMACGWSESCGRRDITARRRCCWPWQPPAIS